MDFYFLNEKSLFLVLKSSFTGTHNQYIINDLLLHVFRVSVVNFYFNIKIN